MVNNLNDGLAWGLFPIFFADAGLSVGRIGVLAALYPAVWGLGQLVTGGAVGPDRPQAAHRRRHAHPGRRHRPDRRRHRLRAVGRSAPSLLGAGTAMVYPTLLAAIGDVAHPTWRARSVGVYRLWRDGGFAVGALLAGVIADVVRHRRRHLGRRRPHRRVRARRRWSACTRPTGRRCFYGRTESARPGTVGAVIGAEYGGPRRVDADLPGPRHPQRVPRLWSGQHSGRGRR